VSNVYADASIQIPHYIYITGTQRG